MRTTWELPQEVRASAAATAVTMRRTDITPEIVLEVRSFARYDW
jgi:hypothetical protein